MPRRTAADAAATRRTILDAARATFADGGYQAATLDGIAVRAGVTRGAVHHHFGDKRELFVEVFEQVEREINEAVVAAALAATPTGLEPFKAGCRALFELFARPDLRRIVLADAPAVLGLVAWYEIDRGLGLATIRAGLQALADDGALAREDTDALALVLYGALTEASLALGAGLTTVDQADIIETVERILRAFVPTAR
ncbi:MAG: TetR/AcrR family transcriptional regulator [Acidimicrobiales bacterium]